MDCLSLQEKHQYEEGCVTEERSGKHRGFDVDVQRVIFVELELFLEIVNFPHNISTGAILTYRIVNFEPRYVLFHFSTYML